MNAACTGCRFTCAATPSIVVTSRSRTIAASIMQASTRRPSTCTVQAPHSPRSQPFFARRLNEHFGRDPGELPVVGQGFPSRDQPNLQRALDTFLASNDRRADLVGVVSTYKRFNGIGLADLVSKQE